MDTADLLDFSTTDWKPFDAVWLTAAPRPWGAGRYPVRLPVLLVLTSLAPDFLELPLLQVQVLLLKNLASLSLVP